MSNLATFSVAESQIAPIANGKVAVVAPIDCDLPHRDVSGAYTLRPAAPTCYLSMQPWGTLETREMIGPWEEATRKGNKLHFYSGGKYWTVLIAEGL